MVDGKGEPRAGRIPTLHVVAETIPQAYFQAMKKVWEQGCTIRTEYDRKDNNGEYIDPPSRDSRTLIEVLNPFGQPRFPPTSFCEVGKYIAEILGAKDHLVVPLEELERGIKEGNLDTKWPYTYHQRYTEWPKPNGEKVDQVKLVLDRVAETPFTRRGVASTAVPYIDPHLKEDLPCFREFQLRALDNEAGELELNMTTTWRSRDLYKAWQDNVVAVTFWQQVLAKELEKRTGKRVRVGSYADFSMSLHIYGQDFPQVKGDEEKGLKSFFENLNEDNLDAKCMTSDDARDMLVLPHLRELAGEDYWNFTDEKKAMIRSLIERVESGQLVA